MSSAGVQFLIDLRARFDTLTPAQNALSSLEKQILKEKAALEKLETKLKTATPKQAADLLKQVDAQRKVVGELERAAPAWRQFAKTSAGATKEAAGGLAEMGAASGGMLGQLSNLARMAGTATGAIGILVGAVMAVVAASVLAFVSLVRFALVAGDAARASYLLSAAATGSAAGGAELEAVISQLARRIPLAREKLAGMARDLATVKLRGREAQAALTAMGIVASARGDSAAASIKGIAEQSKAARRFLLGAKDIYGEFTALAGTGIKAADIYSALADSLKVSIPQAKALLASGKVTVQQGMVALEKAAQARFGDTIAGQMASLTNQLAKAKENFAALFERVHLDNFLKGLQMVTGLLSKDTMFGYVLSEVLTTGLNDFFNTSAKVFPYVRAFLIGLAIGALTVYLYFLKAKKAVGELGEKLGLSGKLKGIDGLTLAMYAGIGAVGLLVLGFGLLAAALFLAILPLGILLVMVGLLAALPLLVIYGFYRLADAVAEAVSGAWESIKGIDLLSEGSRVVESLIAGIKSKVPALIAAVAAMALNIPGTVASVLDMHSPSRVAIGQGQNYTKGLGIGGEKGAEDAEAGAEAGAMALYRGGGKGMRGGGFVGGRVEHHHHYHGDVYGFDDFESRVEQIVVYRFEKEESRGRSS